MIQITSRYLSASFANHSQLIRFSWVPSRAKYVRHLNSTSVIYYKSHPIDCMQCWNDRIDTYSLPGIPESDCTINRSNISTLPWVAKSRLSGINWLNCGVRNISSIMPVPLAPYDLVKQQRSCNIDVYGTREWSVWHFFSSSSARTWYSQLLSAPTS